MESSTAEAESAESPQVDETTTVTKKVSAKKTECSATKSGRLSPAYIDAKQRHFLRWAFPTGKQSMQRHDAVTKTAARLQPNVINEPEDYVIAARRLLHRQRVAGKLLPRFSRSKSANYAALLKAVQEADQGQIDAENMDRLIKTVQAYQVPVFPGRRYTAEDVEKITERLSTYDPEKVPESRGFEIKLELPVVYKKQYTDDDIYSIVKRLSSYDPQKCPPESRGPAAPPIAITQPSRQTLGVNVKKCSSEQVQEIVNRLSRYDPWKWPPSSRNPRLIASRA